MVVDNQSSGIARSPIELMAIQLIADSGSTKTDWRLVDAGGKVHASQTDGLNPYYQSAAQMIDILKAQLHLPQ